MKLIIRILLFVFMLLGLMTSASIAKTRTHGWNFKFALWLIIAHVVLFGLAFILVASSKRTANGFRVGLSPAAWAFGSSLSYLVGFVGFWLAK